MAWPWQRWTGGAHRNVSSETTPSRRILRSARLCREAIGLDLGWLKQRLPFLMAASALLLLFWNTTQPSDPTEAAQAKTFVDQVIRSSLHGYYFQLKNLESPEEPGATIRLPRYDIGKLYFPSLAIYLQKKTFRGPGYRTDIRLLHKLQLLIFLAAVLLSSLPGVDIRIFLAAASVIGLGFLDGFLNISYSGYWAPALAVWMTVVFLLSLSKRVGQRVHRHQFLALGCGTLVGILGMWRADAGKISLAAAAFYAAFLIGHLVVARLFPSMRGEWKEVAKRKVLILHLAVFLVGAQIPHWLVDAHLWLHQQSTGIVHFREGIDLGHPVWHPLYLSFGLGRPFNQFGIKWDDRVAYLHARSENRDVRYLSEEYEHILRRLYLQAVLLEPRLLLDVMRANMTRIWGMLGIVPWMLFAVALLATYRLAEGSGSIAPCRYAFAALLGGLAAGLIPPLLILADALFSTALKMSLWMAPLMTVACITTPAGSSLDRPAAKTRRSLNRATALMAGAVALLPVGFSLFVFYSDARNRAFEDEMVSAGRMRLEEMAREEDERFRAGAQSMRPSQQKEFLQTFADRIGPVTGGGSIQQYPEYDPPFEVVNVTRLHRWFLFVLKSDKPSIEGGKLAVHGFPGQAFRNRLDPSRQQYGFDSFLLDWPGASKPGYFLLVMPNLLNADGSRSGAVEYESMNILYVMAERTVLVSSVRFAAGR